MARGFSLAPAGLVVERLETTADKIPCLPAQPQRQRPARMLFDWLIIGQVVPFNPASAVRGPKHVVKVGKTPVLEATEWRRLLDSIPTDTVRDLRDRALIATLTYSFARVGAALKMRVDDLRPRGAAWTIRLHEKGGKEHAMPCHHALAEALHAYIASAGIAENRRLVVSHGQGARSDCAIREADGSGRCVEHDTSPGPPRLLASRRRSAVTPCG